MLHHQFTRQGFLIVAFVFFAVFTQAQGSLVLVGGSAETAGGWSDEPYQWLVEKASNKRIAVISYQAESNWIPNYFVSMGARFAKNFLIPDRNTADNQAIYDSLLTYDGVFLKGGDQSVYYTQYSSTLTQSALQEIYDRGGVLGGTSAGMAILSPIVYTAQGAYIYPASALSNPFTNQITLKDDFVQSLTQPFIFDTHFVQRGRLGRLAAFMANWFKLKLMIPKGIGVDDRTALCIDPSEKAYVFGTGAVSILRADALAVDTNSTSLRCHAFTLSQLLHGCTIDLNTEVISGFASAVLPAELTENSARTILLSGADQLTVNALHHFVNDVGYANQPIVIITGSNTIYANSLRNSLVNQGADNVEVVQAIDVMQNNQEMAQHLFAAQKILIIQNNYLELMSFLNGTENGALLQEKLNQRDITLFFAGDNARFAGKTVVNKYLDEDFPSYYGELEFDPGLGMLKTSVVMPNTFLNENVYENTTSGLPYAMLKDSAAFGLYLSGNALVRYDFMPNGKTFYQMIDGTIPVGILSFTGGNMGFASHGPYASSRNVAGFESMDLHFLAAGDTVFVGQAPTSTPENTSEHSFYLRQDASGNMFEVNTNLENARISLYDLTGRLLLECDFSNYCQIAVPDPLRGVFVFRLRQQKQNISFTKKVFIN